MYACEFFTGADCVSVGSSGLTHLVVSDNAELGTIPVTSSRVKTVKQQVHCVCTCVSVDTALCCVACQCTPIHVYSATRSYHACSGKYPTLKDPFIPTF